MVKTKKQILILTISIIVVAIFLNVLLGVFLESKFSNYEVDSKPELSVIKKSEVIKYKGVEGENALNLLKKQAKIEQNESGMVVKIGERKASDRDREYWAFYVNGKIANVGSADFKTKNNDVIEWKIEKY